MGSGAEAVGPRALAGKAAVRQVLDQLAPAGWRALHDRACPSGMGIDHVVVGPGAVIVLGTRTWEGHVEVRGDRLVVSGWNKVADLRCLAAQAEVVERCLGGSVGVDHAVVLTTRPQLAPCLVGRAGLLGIDRLEHEILSTPPRFDTAEVERMATHLERSLPAATGSVPAPSVGGGDDPVLGFTTRLLYLAEERSHDRSARLCLHDEHGDRLGTKEVASGEVRTEHRDDELALAVLEAARGDGLGLDPARIPKVPVDLPGGRLFGWLSGVYTSLLVGHLRRAPGGGVQLEGTWANPSDGVVRLEHVDLASGGVVVTAPGRIARDGATAARYLAVLRDRCPLG